MVPVCRIIGSPNRSEYWALGVLPENTAAIGTFREISVSEAVQRATRDLQRRRAEGVAYGIQIPDGSELVAVGRKAYHRWMTRFQDKFGPDAEFRIRSIRLKPSTKV